MKKHTS